ncbi:MAG: type IV pilus assembly protein PilM [Candidatus Pacebacteria bacterium]|nr:type IV pilus assembly protein PilM [Candidatus Paceibacterota bacterium]
MPLFLPKTEAFGIDLSDRSVKMGQVKKKGSKLVLKSLGEKEIPAGFINDGIINKDKEQELIKIIQECKNSVLGAKIKTKKAICSLPEENSFIKVINIPGMKEEEMENVIKWQIESNFPVKMQNVYFDWQIIEGKEKSQKKQKKIQEKNKENQEETHPICVSVVPKEVINSYFSIFKNSGIEPIVFEIESMATVRSLIKSYIERPVIILDIGKCGAGLTFFSGETILFTSHIDISGQKFVEVISKSLGVSLDRAEKIKRKVGLAGLQKQGIKLSKINFPLTNLVADVKTPKIEGEKKIGEKEDEVDAEKVFNALVPILTDLSEQIKQYIDYFKDFKETKEIPVGSIEKIIVCGGESRLIGFTDFIHASLNVSTEIANIPEKISISKNITKNPSVRDFLSYTTVVGLAIRGATAEII